ncbi:unnamed protein product [Brachionus calyciflorus]|uniref:FYVE-type domain-containing protein n=1 Tax=Brachionus calyciflorus TaxID=104777 RepID=A0A813SXI5_9BILA|nr:unnamed protein product [Brachionus calyciflorus]
MSCYTCADKFRFFKKEIGCGNCGYSFCSKCCDKKISVPKKDFKILNVCQKCYQLLTNDSNNKNINLNQLEYSPPKNFLKMVETNNQKYNYVQHNPDIALEKRLENLRANPKSSVTDLNELEIRLRNLQGKTESFNKLSNLPAKEIVKTPEDLISKLTEEVKLDQEYEKYDQRELEKLEERLKNLKAGELKVSEGSKDVINNLNNGGNLEPVPPKLTDSNDEIIKKLLQEAEINLKNKKEDDDDDEWCCLCNNDAFLKCFDCDDDLYCKRCYKQTHSSGEYKLHRKIDLKTS